MSFLYRPSDCSSFRSSESTHGEKRHRIAVTALSTVGLDPKRVSSWHVVNKVMWLLYWFYPYASESYLSKRPEELVQEKPTGFNLGDGCIAKAYYAEFLEHFESNGWYKFDVTLAKFEMYVRAKFPKYVSPYSFLWEDPRWERACHAAFGNQQLMKDNSKATKSGSGSSGRDLGCSSKSPLGRPYKCGEGSGHEEEITQTDEAFTIYYKMYINQWYDLFFPCLGPDVLDFKTVIWPHLPPPESPEDMTVSGVKFFLKKAHFLGLRNPPYAMLASRLRRSSKGKMTRSEKLEVGQQEMQTWSARHLDIVMHRRMPDENERRLTEKAATVVRVALVEFLQEGDSDLTVELECLQD